MLSYLKNNKVIDHPVIGEVSCQGFYQAHKKCVSLHDEDYLAFQCLSLHDIGILI